MHLVTAIDLEVLARRLAEFEAAGHATKDNSRIHVDLTAAGIDKLLGAGRVAVAMRITVAKASEAALAKVADAGGGGGLPAAAGEGARAPEGQKKKDRKRGVEGKRGDLGG